MLDVAIVDDEEDVRAELGQMVRRFCAQEGERVAVREYADGAELLDAAAASAHDVILLDIEMSQVDGMDAAHELRRRGVGAQIVFVTNMAQYAIRGYEVGAFDFVVKPSSTRSLPSSSSACWRPCALAAATWSTLRPRTASCAWTPRTSSTLRCAATS